MDHESKEDIIKHGYGKYYDIVKDLIDDFGWLQISKHDDSFEELFEDIEMIGYFDYELELSFSRPNTIEIWKYIKGYETLYQVSDLGRVRAFEKRLINGKTTRIRFNYKILKGSINNFGYNFFRICADCKVKYYNANRLVYATFKGNLIPKMVIDHKNNNSLDNRLINLQQISQRLNSSKDKKGGTSKYVGVSWSNKYQKWVSAIRVKDKSEFLGSYESEFEASNAYNNKLKQLSKNETN